MENIPQIIDKPKQNWFIRKFKNYQVITFTLGFLLLHRLVTLISAYISDKELFIEKLGLNIWYWAIIILPAMYVLQWLVLVFLASKLPKEELKQIFFKHPIVTIIAFIFNVSALSYRLEEYIHGGIVSIFETTVYYALIDFLWWLLVCWIISKIFKNQRFQWRWYQKVIEIIFIIMPIAYKIILGLIVAFISLFAILKVMAMVFNYSGEDLKILFPNF